MNARSTRRLLTAAVTLVGLAVATVAVAPGASAAAAFTSSGFRPVVGDLTGDGIADRTTLGALGRGAGAVCAYSLERGRGQGRYAAPVAARLPVRDSIPAGEGGFCPNLGVVLKGPSPALDQLAVTWFDFGPHDAPSVQTFRGFADGAVRNTGGFEGPYQPSFIASQDFDGDGYGDVWTSTDQQSGSEYWVGRNQNWHQLYRTPACCAYTNEQFLDLNHKGGTDILAVSGILTYQLEAAVVDGRTGAVQVLARIPDTTDIGSNAYTLTVTDVNHDALPDLLLLTQTSYTDHVTTRFQQFVNQSQGGRWYFQPLPPYGS